MLGICLAPASQFCFVWADLITVYALPTRWWGDSPLRPQEPDHSPYQFRGTSRKRAPLLQCSPKKFWCSSGCFLATSWTSPCARDRKIHTWSCPGSYAQPWNQEEGTVEGCQQKMRDKHKKWSQRKGFPSPFFWLHHGSHPRCQLRGYVSSSGTLWLLTYSPKSAHLPPCHYNIGWVSWTAVRHLYSPPLMKILM